MAKPDNHGKRWASLHSAPAYKPALRLLSLTPFISAWKLNPPCVKPIITFVLAVGLEVLVMNVLALDLTLKSISDNSVTSVEKQKEDTYSMKPLKSEATSHSRRLNDDSLYKPPYPFSAAELWARILKVISSPDAQVSKVQVEQAFDVELSEDAKNRNSLSYSAKQGRDWYLTLKLMSLVPTGQGLLLVGVMTL